MAISGLAWRWWDMLVDGVLRSGGRVLNPADRAGGGAGVGKVSDPGELAEDLRAASHALRAADLGNDGRVDYARVVGSDDYARFRVRCTEPLRALDLQAVDSREERLAFWSNVYNALTVDGAIAHGPVGSTVWAGLRVLPAAGSTGCGFYRLAGRS